MLHDRLADPVDSGVVTDGSVSGVDQDDFKIFVASVLVDPIRVQDTEATASLSNTFFSNVSQVSGKLQMLDTLVLGLTHGLTNVDGSLSASSADSHTIDDVSLLGFVSKFSGLVRTSGSVDSNHSRLLSVLPASNSGDETNNVRLLLLVDLFQVFVGTQLAF